MHLLCSPKCFVAITVFNFSWDDCNTQAKLRTKVMQKFWGQTRCIIGDLQTVNSSESKSRERTWISPTARKFTCEGTRSLKSVSFKNCTMELFSGTLSHLPCVVMQATLGPNQSESSKDNRSIVLRSHDQICMLLTSFFHVTHFDQSQRSKLKTAQIARTNVPRDAPKAHAQTLGRPHT